MADAQLETTRWNPLALASLVLGILGVLGQVVFWAIIPGVLAVVAAVLGFRSRGGSAAGAARAAATWGFRLGVVGITANIVLLVALAAGAFD